MENLIFDIVEGSKDERARAEEKLEMYKASNTADIEDNRRAGIEEAEMERRREKAEKEAAKQRRLAALREEEEEKKDVERSKANVLDRLATSDGDARKIAAQAQKVVLKKSSARRALASSTAETNGSALDAGLTLRGLRKKEGPVVEKPYDPFGGVDLTSSRYILQDDYKNEWLAAAKSHATHTAGGYSMHEYYARTMFEAFSGLGVFIEDEAAGKPQPAASVGMGTASVAQASSVKVKQEYKMKLDDVF